MKLSEELNDWVDYDKAEVFIGQKLGIIGDEVQQFILEDIRSNSPLGEHLASVLQGLVDLGYIEKDAHGTRFRWIKT